MLKNIGYITGHFGKWHLGTMTTKIVDGNHGGRPKYKSSYSPPQLHGFDVCFSTESKVPTWHDPANTLHSRYWNEKGEIAASKLKGDDSKAIMDRVEPFIRNAVSENKPFLSVVWFHTPHLPVVAGPEYLAMYPQYNIGSRHYYGAITAMDEQVGRLRKLLRELEVENNTMVLFCSDNGPEDNTDGSAGSFSGRKRSLLEGGIRVPGLLEWPALITKSSNTSFPVVTSDIVKTIADVVNVNLPDRPYDGISILPLIDGSMNIEVEEEKRKAIGFQNSGDKAWIEGPYKLVQIKNVWSLYNVVKDHSEKMNLINYHPDKVKVMKKRLQEWVDSCKKSDRGGDYKEFEKLWQEAIKKLTK